MLCDYFSSFVCMHFILLNFIQKINIKVKFKRSIYQYMAQTFFKLNYLLDILNIDKCIDFFKKLAVVGSTMY